MDKKNQTPYAYAPTKSGSKMPWELGKQKLDNCIPRKVETTWVSLT